MDRADGIGNMTTRVLREPPFDGLRVVRELEPQDPEGNRGAKAPFDWTQGGEQCRTTKGAKFGKDILTADLRRSAKRAWSKAHSAKR